MSAPVKLADGELYAGVLLGKGGWPHQHIVLLPGETDGVTWKGAAAWAASVGGTLPTRREQALLSANLPERYPLLPMRFEWTWYWSFENDQPNYAWLFRPGDGLQISAFDCDRASARAVRRIPLLECAA